MMLLRHRHPFKFISAPFVDESKTKTDQQKNREKNKYDTKQGENSDDEHSTLLLKQKQKWHVAHRSKEM